LRLLVEVEDAMENRVFKRKFARLSIREDSFQVLVEVPPLSFTPKVVHHEKASPQKVLSQGHNLFIRPH
jgi:hypothetical protein